MKFICEVPKSTVDKILAYNYILDHIEKDNNDIGNDTAQLYKFHCITAHQDPLCKFYKYYRGSTYNVLEDWGENL
jgi:hypothetical protein